MSMSFQDDENKPYFIDSRREQERVKSKKLTRRQIKRKERFAKYRHEKKLERETVRDKPQQRRSPANQNYNRQPEQTERKEQPNIIVVQVN